MNVRTLATAAGAALAATVSLAGLAAGPAMAEYHKDCMVIQSRIDRAYDMRDAALEAGDTAGALRWEDYARTQIALYESAGC